MAWKKMEIQRQVNVYPLSPENILKRTDKFFFAFSRGPESRIT